jgi:hypothetical protein
MMQKIKTFFVYFLAALGVPLVLITFMGAGTWMNLLVSNTGLHISPLYTGGEVRYHSIQNGYQVAIHEPVFAALIGESKEGFVQVDFGPKSTIGLIDAAIDYDNDGEPDFHVWWDTTTMDATLTAYSDLILGLEGSYELNEGYAVRINLKNPRK